MTIVQEPGPSRAQPGGVDRDPEASTSAADAVTWPERLRQRGLRATAGRLAAIAYVDAHPHVTAAELYRALVPELATTSLQAVHNIVHDLESRNLLRRVELPGSAGVRYETRVGDDHHHVQCVVCGRIEDTECVIGHAPCLTPSDSGGMRILTAEVTFRGICSACEEMEEESRD